MNAFELLKTDHDKVAELFDQMEAATGKAKLHIFSQIKSELEVHTHIEETIFYPALEKPRETHDLTLEAYEEHRVVKALLSELDGAKSVSDKWKAKAKVLRENVEHHVKEEENELFDKADDALTDEQIKTLGERMEAEKAKLQGLPAPQRTNKKTAAKTSDNEHGILSRLANFVGLGEHADKPTSLTSKVRRASKKASPKVSEASKSATTKTAAKSASKSKARKSPSAIAKRSPVTHGTKRLSTSSKSKPANGGTTKGGRKTKTK